MKCPQCHKKLPNLKLGKAFICNCGYCGVSYFIDAERDLTYFHGLNGNDYNPSRRDDGLQYFGEENK